MSKICKIVSEFYEMGKMEDAEEHYMVEHLRSDQLRDWADLKFLGRCGFAVPLG